MAKKARKTVKKQSKASKNGLSKPKLTFMDKLPRNRVEYLELLIRMTERRIVPGEVGEVMKAQAIRLKAELEALKASK